MSCITGDETGVVKLWDISRSTGAVKKLSFGEQKRENGVSAMCWRDSSTQEVCLSRKNGIVEVLNLNTQMLSCKKRLGSDAVAAVSSGFSVVRSKLIVVQANGRIQITPVDLENAYELPQEETAEDPVEGNPGASAPSFDDSIVEEYTPKKGAVKKSGSSAAPPTNHAAAPARTQLLNDNAMIRTDESALIYGRSPIEAVHIHRRFALAAVGGRDNDLCVFDLAGERQEPIFTAKNIRDHVLEVPMPVYVAGCCIASPSVFCVATAYHQVRFYDRRVGSGRPVQEFAISREVTRRPTSLTQWNCNKYLIGEASGDVHLYDTRRGFTSRAKLRGGVGSVRQMTKHPNGHQILAVAGLDRKARLFHVPTGKLLQSIYTKQRATCVLLDRHTPFTDATETFSGIVNTKNAEKTAALGDELWDDMDPVVDDDFEEKVQFSGASTAAAPTIKAPGKKRDRE